MKFAIAALLLLPHAALAQDAESLRAAIEQHYAAIHAGDTELVTSHHLPEVTLFPPNGRALMEAGWEEAARRMGSEVTFPEAQVTMRHFSAQLYGNIGIAMFYLDSTALTSRVTAVWVWQGNEWKETHHHESRLAS